MKEERKNTHSAEKKKKNEEEMRIMIMLNSNVRSIIGCAVCSSLLYYYGYDAGAGQRNIVNFTAINVNSEFMWVIRFPQNSHSKRKRTRKALHGSLFFPLLLQSLTANQLKFNKSPLLQHHKQTHVNCGILLTSRVRKRHEEKTNRQTERFNSILDQSEH